MATSKELLECPMCNFTVSSRDDYVLQLHFEQVHTTDSPFRIVDDQELLPQAVPTRPQHVVEEESVSESDEDDNNVLCPEPDCCENIALQDFNDHLEYHAAESLSFDETTGKYHSQRPPSPPGANMHVGSAAMGHSAESTKLSFSKQHSTAGVPHALRHSEDVAKKLRKQSKRSKGGTVSSERSTLSRSVLSFRSFTKNDKISLPFSPGRLGRRDLGPHAWEDRMPQWLHEQLASGPRITTVNRIGRDGRLIKQEQVQNETPGIIPILAQLSALDRSVKEAYYCHPSTLHIGKTPKEGAFCGYRNIQMLISYIQGSKAQGYEEFPGRTPGVLKLQDLIERAWDKGINEIGRQQTGGIRDTRKYIGTPEAHALFLGSRIDCAVETFWDAPDRSTDAYDSLCGAVEAYFAQAAVSDGSEVYKTLLPPIYLQQPGHSITIVGFERRRDGTTNLVVFDPIFHTSPAMHRLLGRKNIKSARPEVLFSYRRGAKDLKKYSAFETLRLTSHPPLFPAWDVLRQFPDCRFLYAFFRSRTLGYDVYPEDHFLRNFPWQQYGGLWSLDEARFARSEPINPLTAQALRRITAEGASNGSSNSSSNSGSLYQLISPISCQHNNEPFYVLPSPAVSYLSNFASHGQASLASPLDGSATVATGLSFGPEGISQAPVLDLIGMHNAAPTMDMVHTLRQAQLALLTDVGRRYPGYPTPLSPTLNAKESYPSPAPEVGSLIATSQSGGLTIPASPAVTASSAMSIDGSEMCGPSRRCLSHGYQHYAAMGLLGAPIGALPTPNNSTSAHESASNSAWNHVSFIPGAKIGPRSLRSPPMSVTSLSPPASPQRPVSPRTAMLKNAMGKQASQGLYFRQQISSFIARSLPPSAWPTSVPSFTSVNLPPSPPGSPPSVHPSQRSTSPTKPHISIDTAVANMLPQSMPICGGTETYTTSPISPQSTMLSYASNRSADNGLLAVRPLSEAQVAEYRFWRPCGRGKCAFGCGGGREGEWGAARRLFRSVEEVKEEEQNEDVCDGEGEGGGMGQGVGREGGWKQKEKKQELERDMKTINRLVRKYGGINLEGRERDGVCEI